MSGTKGTKAQGSGNSGESDQVGDDDKETKKGAGGSDDGGTDEGTDEGEGDAGSDDELLKDPKKLLSIVKSLRSENAKSRKKNKELVSEFSSVKGTLDKLKKAFGADGDDGESDPADAVQKLATRTEQLETELALRDMASEHGIPKEREKYFRFLLNEKFASLEDGEEVTDEDMAEIVKEALAGATPKKASTGVNGGTGSDDGKGGKNPDKDKKPVTVEQFSKMNLGERSELYVKNQPLYQQLFDEASAKGML